MVSSSSEKAQIKSTRSCCVNSRAVSKASLSIASSSPSPGPLPILAYAHSVFATSCELNSLAVSKASPSIASSSPSSRPLPILAYAHSVFATVCELNSPAVSKGSPSTLEGFCAIVCGHVSRGHAVCLQLFVASCLVVLRLCGPQVLISASEGRLLSSMSWWRMSKPALSRRISASS